MPYLLPSDLTTYLDTRESRVSQFKLWTLYFSCAPHHILEESRAISHLLDFAEL